MPHTPLGWAGALVLAWGATLTLLTVVQQFLQMLLVPTGGFRRWSGLALPIGWAGWCVALLYHRVEVSTVMPVLLGTACILVAIRVLPRRRLRSMKTGDVERDRSYTERR